MSDFSARFSKREVVEVMGVEEYIGKCKDDPTMYAPPAQRLLNGIGEPTVVKDPRLARIFGEKEIRTYKPFEDLYALEEVLERIVRFYSNAAKGLEESRQILYLVGPVASGKSTIVDRIKLLLEKTPFYVLAAPLTEERKILATHTVVYEDKKYEVSPYYETPLALFNAEAHGESLKELGGIDPTCLSAFASPWANLRLEEFEGDISKFRVVKLFPAWRKQIGITKVDPGDEKQRSVSALVGKLRDGEYEPSGALNRATQGLVELVEMFKAPEGFLNPLLPATTEHNYVGEGAGPISFGGIIIAHSNEPEWEKFKKNPANAALIDRISVVEVPYGLRVTDEERVLEKSLATSEISAAPRAPWTLTLLSRFAVHTRMGTHSEVNKIRIYDGEEVPGVKSPADLYSKYRQEAGVKEGMSGFSRRLAFMVLSSAFGNDTRELAADPIGLMECLEHSIKSARFDAELEGKYLALVKERLASEYSEFLTTEIQRAYLESVATYGQQEFERYFKLADAWIENTPYQLPGVDQPLSVEDVAQELLAFEKPSGLKDPAAFRGEITKYVLRAMGAPNGGFPTWTASEKTRGLVELHILPSFDSMRSVIDFSHKPDAELKKKHDDFVLRMKAMGYTARQVQRLVEWRLRRSAPPAK